ncbi:MAG: hypothetical protein ABGX27_04145 [Desulfurobacteriaceae bacterium]
MCGRYPSHKGKFTHAVNFIGSMLFFAVLIHNTMVYRNYLQMCNLESPCILLVFSTSSDWKGYGFIGYCFDHLMLKTSEVYIKDCKLHTEYSLVVNIMLVVGLVMIKGGIK